MQTYYLHVDSNARDGIAGEGLTADLLSKDLLLPRSGLLLCFMLTEHLRVAADHPQSQLLRWIDIQEGLQASSTIQQTYFCFCRHRSCCN